MNQKLRNDAEQIIHGAIRAVIPDETVRRALAGKEFTGRIFVVSVGKAAWQMAKSAAEALHQPYAAGIVVTKYGHVQGEIPGFTCYEAGHPIPDENSFLATQAVLDMTTDLKEEERVGEIRNLHWGLLREFRICGMWLYLVSDQMERMDPRMQHNAKLVCIGKERYRYDH